MVGGKVGRWGDFPAPEWISMGGVGRRERRTGRNMEEVGREVSLKQGKVGRGGKDGTELAAERRVLGVVGNVGSEVVQQREETVVEVGGGGGGEHFQKLEETRGG